MRLLALILSFICVTAHAERHPQLPPPFSTPDVTKNAKVIGWPRGAAPRAAAGFSVRLLATLTSPRSMYLLPSGNVLVSQASKVPGESLRSPNMISILKMNNGSLKSVSPFLRNLNLPFGMAVWENKFFVGEATRVRVFPMQNEMITGPGKVIATLPFPAPKRHWTRHLLLNPQGTKLYVSVGSASNVGEDGDPLDPRNAAILEMNLDGSEQKIFANGLRNPVSMAWEPTTHELWTSVNERDGLGDDLVPDYITPVVRGGFYGWPYAYWGQNVDPRRAGERSDLVARSLVPDFSMGTHTAALGITFTQGTLLPAPFNDGALISEHGSWNRSKFAGYRVQFVKFVNGQPVDQETTFLSGFIANEDRSTVYGRPVATVILADGSVLVSDDGSGRIWKVTPMKSRCNIEIPGCPN